MSPFVSINVYHGLNRPLTAFANIMETSMPRTSFISWIYQERSVLFVQLHRVAPVDICMGVVPQEERRS